MMVRLSAREQKKGWWIDSTKPISCAVMPDGLLVVYDRTEIEAYLDSKYPHEGEPKVWFFNKSRDREIAEVDGNRVYANPRVHWDMPASTPAK